MRDSESGLWYARFWFYLQQGPERSVIGAYRLWCAKQGEVAKGYPPQKWYTASKDYDWLDRAVVYDHYLIALNRADDEKLRQKARNYRRSILDSVQEKLTLAIEEWEPDPQKMTWAMLRATMRAINDDSRREWGESEPSKHMGVNLAIAGGADDFERALKQVYGPDDAPEIP